MGSGQETDEKNRSPKSDEDGPEYLDRSKLDFDPDDGLYTGTAVEGTSDIPGPHEKDGDDEPGHGDADQ
ncbi:MAG: hypothetical protein QOI69_257 [Pseudonocardiales bacterium]|jgi:hypothetical protein|nr:hypothetical protein [Pseudonocardiales bacterium]